VARERRGNLPPELTSFVGRRTDIGRLRRNLEAHRALTVTGTGGVGKTRLALKVAAEVERAFRDGVWLVELDELTDGDLVAATALNTLGVRNDGEAPSRKLVSHLSGAQALLVLDGCDEVVDTCAQTVHDLLRSAPGVRILCTSRTPLRIVGEAMQPLTQMAVPRPGGDLAVSDLACYDSVALFVERARATRPDFALTEANAVPVARICHSLDGLPIAIELAADRLSILSMPQLASRLDDAYRFLTGTRRDAPHRQRTLRALADSSRDLCSMAELRLWARLAVFPGPFDLEAVEHVCGGVAQPGEDVLAVLAGLIDKSVLSLTDDSAGSWYQLPRLLRDYALEELVTAGEARQLADSHAARILNLAEQAAAGLLSSQTDASVHLLRGNHGNIRAALEHYLACDPNRALRLASVLWHYWAMADRVEEGRAWLGRALADCPEPTAGRASALATSAYLALINDGPDVMDLLGAAQAIAADLRDPSLTREILFVGGLAALRRNDVATAEENLERALALLRTGVDDPAGVARTYWLLTMVWVWNGDISRGTAYSDAFKTTAEGDSWGRALSCWNEAMARAKAGDAVSALRAQRDCVRLVRQFDDRFGMTWCVQSSAIIMAGNGHLREAALLLGAGNALPVSRLPFVDDMRRSCAAKVRAGLGSEKYGRLYEEGRCLSLRQALDLVDASGPDTHDMSDSEADCLSGREREVANLIAEGRSNKEIAAALVISTRTAEGHVRRILSKLSLSSRAQVAAWMTEHRDTSRRHDLVQAR
jgi:non-specific serine/threonine protein kinase